MSEKKGYIITTWRLRLRCSHPEYLQQTQDYYNLVQKFYYDLLLRHPELWNQSSQQILRELECLSLPGREKRTPEMPLPWDKVPLYFRRAAGNAAIAAAKSTVAREQKGVSANTRADSFHSAVVYYKGMYRDFSASGITLKVWNGTDWQWLHCRLYGKDFPQAAQTMSPSVVFEYKYTMLHVPVKETTADATSLKERLKDGKSICSLQFTNRDSFAVASISGPDGSELANRFFKGGKAYAHHCRKILDQIAHSEQAMGPGQTGRPNQKYWMHLKHLSDHYAHQISSEIVDFCTEHEASVIALPKYGSEYTRSVMRGAGNWSPLHLSTRIREYLTYKAWKAGMIVIEVNAAGIGTSCAACQGAIARVDKQTDEFICENGHRGSHSLNTARNLGRKCREQFGKHAGEARGQE